MSKIASKKCPTCKGVGKFRNGLKGSFLRCRDCDGTGVAHRTVMVFWPYDQFPFVLCSPGFMRDNGWAYCPSYGSAFLPVKVMELQEGEQVKKKLEALVRERDVVLKSLEKCWKAQIPSCLLKGES